MPTPALARSLHDACCREALELIDLAGVHLTPAERDRIGAVDFGLGDLRREGIQIITLFATERLSAKILVLLPNQTEPEHWHPPVGEDPGKEEHIRALWGDLRFYLPGEGTIREGFIPAGKEDAYALKREVVLQPGDALELPAGTPHWFQAGPRGAVMTSISTCVRDGLDGFTDPAIVREVRIDESA